MTKKITPQQIKSLRAASGLNQASAAALVSVSESAWSLWENGKRVMPPGMFELFAIKTASHRIGPVKMLEALRTAGDGIYHDHRCADDVYRAMIERLGGCD